MSRAGCCRRASSLQRSRKLTKRSTCGWPRSRRRRELAATSQPLPSRAVLARSATTCAVCLSRKSRAMRSSRAIGCDGLKSARAAWRSAQVPSTSDRPSDLGSSIACRRSCARAPRSPRATVFTSRRRAWARRPESRELVVASPFDFATRAVLYLPDDLPEPSAPGFDESAAARIGELVRMTDGGAFVLCTSTRAAKSIHARLPRMGLDLMIQGEGPKHLMLERFRASGRAVLVATMSFWEGVDVPGWALRLVILDKIPFAPPGDPVVAARCNRLDQNGGSGFAEYSVPTAAMALKQDSDASSGPSATRVSSRFWIDESVVVATAERFLQPCRPRGECARCRSSPRRGLSSPRCNRTSATRRPSSLMLEGAVHERD